MCIWGVILILFEKTWPVSSIFGLGQPTNIGCGGGGLRANYGVLAKWVSYNWADYDLTSALCGFPNYPICQLYIWMDLTWLNEERIYVFSKELKIKIGSNVFQKVWDTSFSTFLCY